MKGLWTEAKKTLTLALPLVMGLVGAHAMTLIDAAMIGDLGVEPLAAAAFGANVTAFFLIIGFGLCTAIQILVAQSHGRGNSREGLLVLQAGLWLVSIYSMVLSVVAPMDLSWLYHLGQPEEVVIQSEAYVVVLFWSILPALAYHALKAFYEAQNRPWLPFIILVLGLLSNVLMNWLLIYGKLGFPAMGLDGAGVATFLARLFMLLALGAYLLWERFRGMVLRLKDFFRVESLRVRRILSLGIPSAFQLLFEIGLFTAVTVMMGWFGATELAAHHIALSVTSLIFMVPLGYSIATTIRVAEAVGLEDPRAVRRISLSSLMVSTSIMGIFAVMTFSFRWQIPLLFIDNSDVVRLASQMLIVTALFQIFDGLQVGALGALRGLGDVKVPTLFAFVGYWLVSLPVGLMFAFYYDFKGVGLWFGLLTGILLASIVLTSRLFWQFKQPLRVLAAGE